MTSLIFIFLAASLSLSAQQIPNANFEAWHTVPGASGKEDPDHWESTNRLLNPNSIGGITKSTDAHSGNYAVKLVPSQATGNNTELILGKLPIDSLGNTSIRKCQGHAVSYLPLVITGYYKFLPSHKYIGAGITIYFTQGCYNGIWVADVLGNEPFVPYSNEYKPFAVPIQFNGGPFPGLDTMVISLQISGRDTGAVSSFLLVDDIAMLGQHVGVEELAGKDLDMRAFPNPTSGKITLKTAEAEVYQIQVYSHISRLIDEQNVFIEREFEMELQGPAGVYVVRVSSEQGSSIFKVIKE